MQQISISFFRYILKSCLQQKISFIHRLKKNVKNTRRNDLFKVQIHILWMSNVQVATKLQQVNLLFFSIKRNKNTSSAFYFSLQFSAMHKRSSYVLVVIMYSVRHPVVKLVLPRVARFARNAIQPQHAKMMLNEIEQYILFKPFNMEDHQNTRKKNIVFFFLVFHLLFLCVCVFDQKKRIKHHWKTDMHC